MHSFNAFDGLETEKQVLAALKAAIPHVKPTMRTLGRYDMTTTDDHGQEYVIKDAIAQCADTDIYESIMLIYNTDPKAREWLLEFNRKYAAGTAGTPEPEIIDDFDKASNFRDHAAFLNGIPDGVLRVPIAIEADEADVS